MITEDQEQAAAAQYLDLIGVLWCHPPNGGHRNKIVAAKLKKHGAKPGVPDILIFTPPPKCPQYRGVAIELKRMKGGVLSQSQKDWIYDLTECGWLVKRCNGSGEVVDFCKELGFQP